MKNKNRLIRAVCAMTLAVCGTASAGIIGSSSTNFSIPDGSSYTTTAIGVLSHGAIGNLTINVAIDHSWLGDLKITLIHSTTATAVVLMDRPGVPASMYGSNANLSPSFALSFSDASGRPAAETIGSGCSNLEAVGSTATCSGTAYLSHEALSAFTGEDQWGAWYLRVEDLERVSRGNLVGWSIDNTSIVDDPVGVPEPASFGLMALALAGMGAARRRRQRRA